MFLANVTIFHSIEIFVKLLSPPLVIQADDIQGMQLVYFPVAWAVTMSAP
jgi:hypothetical protein